LRVVIADDARALRTVLGGLLARLGHVVAGEATDEASVLALLPSARADAVVVDGRLPPGGGVAAIRAIRAAHPDVEIYVVAALEERDLVRAALASGATGAIQRPFVASLLERSLRPTE
jgi:DNA-binding NarL/FixJ family response regulator